MGDPDARLTLLDSFLWRDEGIPGPVSLRSLEARLRSAQNLLVLKAEKRWGMLRGSARVWSRLRQE